MVWLGHCRLPMALFTSESSKHSVCISFLKVSCQRNRKNWDFKKTSRQWRIKNLKKLLFWAFIEKLVSDLLAIPCLTCQANKHFAKKISQLFYYLLTNESSICLNINSVNTSNDFISTIDKFLLQNVWDSFDCHFGQGWDNWFSLTNCSEETFYQMLWRWIRFE